MIKLVEDPVSSLLQQALSLTESRVGIPVIIDYEEIVRAAIKVSLEQREREAKDPRRVITQNEAHNLYGKSVITALFKRGKLQKYKFDLREAYDRDGEVIQKAKGVVYYRVIEIEKAIEEGNILNGTRRVIL